MSDIAVPGQLADIAILTPLDQPEATQMVCKEKGDRNHQSQASNH